MPRHARLSVLPAFGLVLLVLLVGPARAQTPQASPAATPTETYPPGITVDTLGRGQPARTAGEGLLLLRVTYAPGAVIPPHTNPGASVFSVESGTMGLRLEVGSAEVTRAGSQLPQRLEPGSEVILNSGDAVFYDEGTRHTTWNAGDAPATILIAALYATGQPLLQPASAAPGTPAP